MGICQNKGENNKIKKQCSKELLQMFQQTKQLQEKFMKEVYDQEKQNESKLFNNIKTSQSVDPVNNSTHYQRRKGVSVNRMAMSNVQKGINLIADKKSNNPKDFPKQKYHKVIGLLLSNINLGKMTILENNETNQLVMCETLKRNEENQHFLQWLKQKNIVSNNIIQDHDNIIRIQEIQSSDYEYQIIYEFWQDQFIYSINENNVAIILYQMFEAIEYLHENDLRYSSLTFDSFRFQTNKQNSIIKLTSLRNIYELPNTSLEILKYSPPGTYKYPADRSKPRDVWALGIIALQLLLGQFPFIKQEQLSQKRIVSATINGLTTEQIQTTIDGFHKDIKQLLLGMLQIDQNERYTINHCKISQFIQINLVKYQEQLIFPIKNFFLNHQTSQGKLLARFHLVRVIDKRQFISLHNLFTQIDYLKTKKIGNIQIRDYYDQIYQPASTKNEINKFINSLPKSFEVNQIQFIGLTCKLTQEQLEKYYTQNIHQSLSIRENIKLLQLTQQECKMIKQDFSKNQIVQKLSFDLFLKYII